MRGEGRERERERERESKNYHYTTRQDMSLVPPWPGYCRWCFSFSGTLEPGRLPLISVV